MNNIFLSKQIVDAKENCNYFFIKFIFCFLVTMIKVSFVLLLSCIFNYVIINIIALIYSIYSLINIINYFNYYYDIIMDIRSTLGYSKFAVTIDLKSINYDYFKGMVKYGK